MIETHDDVECKNLFCSLLVAFDCLWGLFKYYSMSGIQILGEREVQSSLLRTIANSNNEDVMFKHDTRCKNKIKGEKTSLETKWTTSDLGSIV